MQDNRLQLTAEVKAKMEAALDRYYTANGINQQAAEEAHTEYQLLKNEYYELTGELHEWE